MQSVEHVFILGNPRSGTSLFRIILNNHPEIVAPPECGFAQWWLKKYGNWKLSDLKSERLDQFLIDLFKSKKFETWKLTSKVVKNIILKNKPSSYSELVSCVYLSYSENPDAIRVVIDKNNYYINHIMELDQIWPMAKYLHLVRDGRDVACSYLEMSTLKSNSNYKPTLSSSIDEIAREWVINNKIISSLDNGNNYELIKYENLINYTSQSLKNICEFLDIEYSERMLDYYKNNDSKKSEPTETLDWKMRTREKPDNSRISRYKEFLTEAQIKIFSEIALQSLKNFKYE